MRLRLDFMPPEYREAYTTRPHDFYLEPFCIEGNLYFIGNREIGCYLIDSGEGLIILDTGYDFTAGQLINSIWTLGYDPKDVKMIFHTHNHQDHIGATNLLVALSRATTYMSETDGKELAAALGGNVSEEHRKMMGTKAVLFVPDVYTHDGDVFTLGNVRLTALDTPGHTRGCQSFFFNVTGEDGKQYTAAIHGGWGIPTLHKELMEKSGYLTAREDYFAMLDKVEDMPVDIHIGSHVLQSFTEEKLAKREADPDGPNPFIDPTEWKRVAVCAREMALELIETEEKGETPEWQRTGYTDLK